MFPGNLQGRHARETGEKGAALVHVQDGRVVDVEHRALDVVRWERLLVDAEHARDGGDVVALVRDGIESLLQDAGDRLLCVRVQVAGASAAHQDLCGDAERWENAIRAAATDLGGAWIEKVRFGTAPRVDGSLLADRDDAIGQLARAFLTLEESDEALEALMSEVKDLEKKLPAEARRGDDGLRLRDPAFLRSVLHDVERLVLGRLLARGGTE